MYFERDFTQLTGDTPGRHAEVQRPEHGSGDDRYTQNPGAFDQMGWGTLVLYE